MESDLSFRHEPVGGLFPHVPSGRDPAEFRLSEDQIIFFRRYGFLAGVPVLSAEEVARLRTELVELTRTDHPAFGLWYEFHSNESTDPATVLFHALGAWRIAPGFHDLLWHPAFYIPASQLLGGAVRFWHDQLFCKPAHHGGVVAWHQDYSYWTRTEPISHLTCWIALDDSTRENGCLRYIAGSHRWDLMPITGLAGDMDAIRRVVNDEQWQAFQDPMAIELRAGQASFHHPLLVHGSYENRTSGPRRATVINVVRDGVRSASDLPLLEGVPKIPKGEALGGRFFPLLYDAE
jgi:hypothetical protein